MNKPCCVCYGKSPEIVSSNPGMIDGHICFCSCHYAPEKKIYKMGKNTFCAGCDRMLKNCNCPTPQKQSEWKLEREKLQVILKEFSYQINHGVSGLPLDWLLDMHNEIDAL